VTDRVSDLILAFAAVHQRLRYRGEDTSLYAAAAEDGTMFFSRHQPKLYDRMAIPMATREIPPGSRIRIQFFEKDGINWMEAIQVVCLAEDGAPFEPVFENADG